MANEKNLNHKLTVSEQRKGGQNSGRVRREKKTIQRILDDYLSRDIESNKDLKKIAKAAGIESNQSIKELMTVVCVLNTIKDGDVNKLLKMCEILGEDNNIQTLEDISEAEADIFGTD